MMKEENQLWDAEKQYYADVASNMVGRRMHVNDTEEDALAYTEEGSEIYIARNHPIYMMLTKKEKRTIRFGCLVHEALHQVFTNFKYDRIKMARLQKAGRFKNDFDKAMYHKLVNLVEDPAIESMAEQVVGGPALKALYFTIAKIDELSGDFDDGCMFPFEEVFNALIQFGDLGLIHGTFRFATAKVAFTEISPLFYQAMNEPNGQKRIDLVFPIYQVCRKLWIGYSDSKLESLLNAISNKQKKHGDTDMNGSGSGTEGKRNERSRKNRKRKATIRKVLKEEYEKAKENPEFQDDGVSDIEVLVCDDPDKTKAGAPDETKADTGAGTGDSDAACPGLKESQETKPGEEKASGTKKRAKKTPAKPQDQTEKGDDSKASGDEKTDQSNNLEGFGSSPSGVPSEEVTDPDNKKASLNEEKKGERKAGQKAKEKPEKNPNTAAGDSFDFESDEELLEPDEIRELSDEEYKTLLNQIEQKYGNTQEKQENMETYYSELPEYEEISQKLGCAGVRNQYVNRVSIKDEQRYDELVESMADGIAMMQEELRNIFLDDRSRKGYSDSGRVSMKRFASGRVTTRLFERKLRSAEKSNMCIGICGDCSGSMSGDKIRQEILALIALAETFGEFSIPLYFMGFNVQGTKPVQTHYIRWDNSRFERERLLYLEADGSNFDSYSIRYMTNLIQERPEKHKLMFVLSDGRPSFLFINKQGIQQNALAIQEARNSRIDVIGIGIGAEARGNEFIQMYGKESFFHVNQPNDLFDNLAAIITSTVNGWN